MYIDKNEDNDFFLHCRVIFQIKKDFIFLVCNELYSIRIFNNQCFS